MYTIAFPACMPNRCTLPVYFPAQPPTSSSEAVFPRLTSRPAILETPVVATTSRSMLIGPPQDSMFSSTIQSFPGVSSPFVDVSELTLYVTDGCTQSVNIPTNIMSNQLATSPSFALHLFVDVSKFIAWSKLYSHVFTICNYMSSISYCCFVSKSMDLVTHNCMYSLFRVLRWCYKSDY